MATAINKRVKTSIYLLFLLYSIYNYSQTITARVLSKSSKLPVENASVYFDGTTLGTITNTNGTFSLDIETPITTPLVISCLGFKTQYISEYSSIKEIYLEEDITSLNEVVIKPDDWSRKKKLRYFKNQFLGTDKASLDCKIENENDLRLKYDSNTNILYAWSKVPLVIINKHLGYKIEYSLIDFEVNFKQNVNGFNFIGKVFFSGTSKFSNLKKKPKNKQIKARKKAYYGSKLHFMRALSKKQLLENAFKIYTTDDNSSSNLHYQVNPYDYFLVSKQNNGITNVKVTKPKLVIQYNDFDQSSIIIEDNTKPFIIDAYGIYSPISHIYFSGEMGFKRVSTMLPLNYEVD